DVLRTVARLPAPDAERLVASAPCEVVVWEETTGAHALREALAEAGAAASIEERAIVVPPPIVLPDRAVILEREGADKLAVMKVVRSTLDLGLAEVKDLVDGAPCMLVEALEGTRAAAFVAALIAAGAS